MRQVWLVTSGEYSDFRVIAAFSTEEAANTAMNNGLGDGVEACSLDCDCPPPPAGMDFWNVQLDPDGNVFSRPPQFGPKLFKPYKLSRYKGLDLQIPNVSVQENGKRFQIGCWARDAEHAIKIANELRVQEIAKVSHEST